MEPEDFKFGAKRGMIEKKFDVTYFILFYEKEN